MLNVEAYVLAKKYTDKSIEGAGGLKGAPCQVKSIVDIPGGHRITLSWIDDEGDEETQSFDVMDGVTPTVYDDPTNAIEIKEDGSWYVADVQGVEISDEPGNILEEKNDGLYVGLQSITVDPSTDGILDVNGEPLVIYEEADEQDIDDLFNT